VAELLADREEEKGDSYVVTVFLWCCAQFHLSPKPSSVFTSLLDFGGPTSWMNSLGKHTWSLMASVHPHKKMDQEDFVQKTNQLN
jgi:hypothetical protein